MTSSSGSKVAAYLMLALTGLVGWGSLLALVLSLFFGPFGVVSLALSETTALWLDAGLCLAFFAQHSGMVRKPFRRWLRRFVAEHYDGAVYAIASGIVLLVLTGLWQESGHTLAAVEGIARWPFRAVFLLSILGFAWGVRALGTFDPLGFRPILDHLHGRSTPPAPFTITGPYRWVRHPLYSFSLLMIWSCPDLTADRLMFNALWSVWIIVGTVLEERDLVSDLGETYRVYQRSVPMLVPWPVGRAARP
jgi:protein-S-isoprenylcysteine O-methyltransferase Ste14